MIVVCVFNAKALSRDFSLGLGLSCSERDRLDTVVVFILNSFIQGLSVSLLLDSNEKFECSGQGGFMVARVKLKVIDGKVPLVMDFVA